MNTTNLNGIIKKIQDIMRNDSGVNGDAQRIEQIVWILFLKIYDSKEKIWELNDDNYKSIVPEKYRWKNWAVDNKDGKALTGDELLNFINNELFPNLKNIPISQNTTQKESIVPEVFADANNYMKNGVLLRQVINYIDSIEFENYSDRHMFGEIYETFLKNLQSAGNAGEFYTPRALTDFILDIIKPKLGEKIADFACGTGGFLVSALKLLEKDKFNDEQNKQYDESIYGIEKKQLPYILCITNLFLHGIDNPLVYKGNSLERNVKEYAENDKFDIIVMNPPYGGSELESIKINFPMDLRSSETADLFMILIMYRLKYKGRAAVILPDGFLFSTDNNAKINIKKKLLNEFNLHTIIRLPHSVFAPYTSITTNILFFDNNGKTENTWFYRMDMPEGYKNFSKTKPLQIEHMKDIYEWWNNRKEIEIEGFFKSKKYTLEEIINMNYNLDLCGYPHKEEVILEPLELINKYQEEKKTLNNKIDDVISQILDILKRED